MMEPEPNLDALLAELLNQWDEEETAATGELESAPVEESLAGLAAAQAEVQAERALPAPVRQTRQQKRNSLLDMVRTMHGEMQERRRATAEGTDTREGFVLFRLGACQYGIPIRQVVAVDRPPRVTAIPFVPGYVRGLANRRGEILPLIDLRVAAGEEARSGEGRMLVVRAREGGSLSGLVVDGLAGIAWIGKGGERPAAGQMEDGSLEHWLRGAAEEGGRRFGIVGLDKMFASRELGELRSA